MFCEKNSTRLDKVRDLVDEMLLTKESTVMKEEAWAHLSAVSDFASKLAMKRGQDAEIAAIAGLLHSYYFYKTGIAIFPGPNSADSVRPIIRGVQIFSKEEMNIILRSVFYQEDRYRVDGPYEEIIKDALLVQMYFKNIDLCLSRADVNRLHKVFVELEIPGKQLKAEANVSRNTINRNAKNRRLLLADFAEKLAVNNITGIPEDERYRDICRYWPDADIYKVLEKNWCAAFVYHCCMLAGLLLPIRYPNRMYRLAGVGAWLDWARLSETGFFYQDKQHGFMPARGDIVIFEKLLTDNAHDHIGIVLACDEYQILVAEGNVDNKNYSGVLYRDRGHCILGYIRINNSYNYRFDGEYIPVS